MSAGQGSQAINRVSSKGCSFWAAAAVSVSVPFVCLGPCICQSAVGTAPAWDPHLPAGQTTAGWHQLVQKNKNYQSFLQDRGWAGWHQLVQKKNKNYQLWSTLKHALHWLCICTIMLVSDFKSIKVWQALVGKQ